jgi:CheY-like chemotaxis protein
MSEIIHILLVEDNPDHADLVMASFEEGRIVNKIHWVKDGEQALHYLRRKNSFEDPAASPTPGLILLDINLPKVDGLSVLKGIKENPRLKRIPVIMLTTSDQHRDIDRCYEIGANSYIIKPVDYHGFQAKMQEIGFYWVLTNQLPSL